MRNFHGAGHRRGYFEGWYFKHQGPSDSLSLIPAYHTDRRGRASASLQIITPQETFSVPFPAEAFHARTEALSLALGGCRFSSSGCALSLRAGDVSLTGSLRYGPFLPLNSDIMGPFRFVPLMQCRHSVFSLSHRVDGSVTLNGREYRFQNGLGYLEGDRGVSFPSRYLWTQCSRREFCVMISVADIPICGTSFTGCIASVLFEGREFRLATYLGAKPLTVDARRILLRQGGLTLEAELLTPGGQPLRAPSQGEMTRVIREHLSCPVRYRLTRQGQELFHFVDARASFESAWSGDNPSRTGET